MDKNEKAYFFYYFVYNLFSSLQKIYIENMFYIVDRQKDIGRDYENFLRHSSTI